MSRTRHRISSATLAGLILLGITHVARAQPAATPTNTCVTCHLQLSDQLAAPARLFADDVHGARGFGCVDCHGGDPATPDQKAAKDPARGFRGVPSGPQVIETCARCHSDAAFMRRFAPTQRVDQESEYAVSVHGQRLAKGDRRLATCASCHAAHGIRQISDVRSPVFPTNVAATCGRCHGDPAYMKGYELDSAPFPTSQRADYETSVHHQALTARNNLSAPTCNDCHGNHGAAPPGVDAVTNVCGTCHAVFAQRFEPTTHAFVFERGCVECHGNHAIAPADDELVGADAGAVCSTCHTQGDTGLTAAALIRGSLEEFKRTLQQAEVLIARARTAGMEMSDEQIALGQARSHLTLARTELHTFDPEVVDAALGEGRSILTQIEAAGQRALAELQYRRRGLAISLAVILLFVVAIGFKVRQLDRRLRG